MDTNEGYGSRIQDRITGLWIQDHFTLWENICGYIQLRVGVRIVTSSPLKQVASVRESTRVAWPRQAHLGRLKYSSLSDMTGLVSLEMNGVLLARLILLVSISHGPAGISRDCRCSLVGSSLHSL